MTAGDVVLARLPQADEGVKIRPAVLLCRLPPFEDWLACGVSSQTRHLVADFDELLEPGDADYPASGVRAPSLIRLGFLGVLSKAQIGGAVGRIDATRLQRLRHRLVRCLQPETAA